MGIFVVVLFPLVYSLWLSFTDVNLLRTGGPAIEACSAFACRCSAGWASRTTSSVFEDPLYWSSLWRTLYFVGAFVVEATLVGIGMALVLNERFAGRPLMRSLLLVPWSLSRVVVGPALDRHPRLRVRGAQRGAPAGPASSTAPSRSSRTDGRPLNVLVSVYMWNQAPFASLLFLAAMQSISDDLYAAAEVDGAGYWQRFRHVTLPALRPIVFLVLVLCHRERIPDARPDLRPHDGRPRATTRPPSRGSASRPRFTFFKFGPGTAILYTLTALCLLLTFVYHRLILAALRAGGLRSWRPPSIADTGEAATGHAPLGSRLVLYG